MRIAVLTAAYPSPAEPERAIFLENLHRELLEAAGGDLAIEVVAPRVHPGDPLRETRHGIQVHRFRYPSGGRRLKEAAPSHPVLAVYFLSALWRTWRVLRRGSPRLLICHWVLPCGPVAALAARLASVPVVFFAHGSDLNRYARLSPAAFELARWSLSRAVAVVAVSAELAQAAREELGVAGDRVHVLPMGVGGEFAPGDREKERAALGLGPDWELLAVGDLLVEKGILELLEAFEGLRRAGVRARLHVVGEGPLRGGAPGRNGAGVEWRGRMGPGELARWYRAADLLVHASHGEGAPLVVMEALASGLPVVATRVGGIPELVEEGKTGKLVAPRDAGALETALRELLAAPAELEAMRAALRHGRPELSARQRARKLYPLLAAAAGLSPAQQG
jgi:teichuronic acid biosynthesis glycosyltransferase TuaC